MPFDWVTNVSGICSSAGVIFLFISALFLSLRRLIWTWSCSLLVKNTFLQPTSFARDRVSSLMVSQWDRKIFSHNSSLEQTFRRDLHTDPSLAMSTRSRNDNKWMRTFWGRRANQSLHTMLCTRRSVSSPKIRLMSVWSKESSSNSSIGTFRWLGGMYRWSFLIEIRHVLRITWFSVTRSWWKSLLGDGACLVFSNKIAPKFMLSCKTPCNQEVKRKLSQSLGTRQRKQADQVAIVTLYVSLKSDWTTELSLNGPVSSLLGYLCFPLFFFLRHEMGKLRNSIQWSLGPQHNNN